MVVEFFQALNYDLDLFTPLVRRRRLPFPKSYQRHTVAASFSISSFSLCACLAESGLNMESHESAVSGRT